MKRILVCIMPCLLLVFTTASKAQDSIPKFPQEEETTYITKAFFGTRVLNGHSVETTPKGTLDLKIQHRMGRLDQGFVELFGLDQAAFAFGFEYGVLDWLMVGVGRSTLEKQYDGFIKVKLLRQSKGKVNMPLSVIGYAGIGINGTPWAHPERVNYFSSRMSYTYQLIIGRKFGERVGLQVAPTFVYKNLVPTTADHNGVFAIGFGGRVRFSNRVAFTAEYYYVLPNQIASQYNGADVTNNLSAGFEIYTGKHVFNLFLTNGTGMSEVQFVTQNTESWLTKGIHIGFNMTRLFRVAEY
jgi:hypothetical protein